MKEMIWKKDGFEAIPKKQWALELTWRQMADCSKGDIRWTLTKERQAWCCL